MTNPTASHTGSSDNRYGLSELNDGALVQRLTALVAQDRVAEAELVAHIGEVDARRVYAQYAHSSMHSYAVTELRLSDDAAFNRIRAARAARRYPVLFDKIASGELHLTASRMLSPHLTKENHQALIVDAAHKTKREVELLLAARFPKPDVPDVVRKLPRPRMKNASVLDVEPATQSAATSRCASKVTTGSDNDAAACAPRAPVVAHTAAPAKRRDVVAPLAEGRFMVQFTADAALEAKLKRAKELLGFQVGPNDLAAVFDRALDLLVSDLENKKHGVTSRPRGKRYSGKRPSRPASAKDAESPTPSADDAATAPVEAAKTPVVANADATDSARGSRYISRAVRREVFARDGGQCTFVDARGRRCQQRCGLEYHHQTPHACGGANTAANVRLVCKGHNLMAAVQDFGRDLMGRYVRRTDGQVVPEPP